MTSPNFPTPFTRRASPSNGRGRHKPCGISCRTIHDSSRFLPETMMKRFQAFSEPNDEMFKYHWLLGKITSIPPQRGRSLVFLKRRTAYPFFLSLAGYVFPRSAERRRKTVL